VKIYSVWVNQRVTDERDQIDVGSIPSARHYWDDDWATGRWVAEHDLGGLGYQGAVYDAYFLFGPNATWDDVPQPLVASGQPVVGASELEDAVAKLT
jgi:hypothetical protein